MSKILKRNTYLCYFRHNTYRTNLGIVRGVDIYRVSTLRRERNIFSDDEEDRINLVYLADKDKEDTGCISRG